MSNIYNTDEYTSDFVTKCIENNIYDAKTCCEFNQLQNSKYHLPIIQKKFDTINQKLPDFKECIKRQTGPVCYFSYKKNGDYYFDLGYFKEYNAIYNNFLRESNIKK